MNNAMPYQYEGINHAMPYLGINYAMPYLGIKHAMPYLGMNQAMSDSHWAMSQNAPSMLQYSSP